MPLSQVSEDSLRDATSALRLSTTKLKYLKKPRMHRLPTIEAVRPSFCVALRGPPTSSSETAELRSRSEALEIINPQA